jgi:hypothetical protein
MLTITSTFVRPSASVEFFTDAVFDQYRAATYAGKYARVSEVISEDGLTRTVVGTWTTRLNFTAFMADPVVNAFQHNRRAHLTANGIVKKDEFNYVPSEGDDPPAVNWAAPIV